MSQIRLFLILTFASTVCFAEFLNPFDNQSIYQNSSAPDSAISTGIAGGVFNSKRTDPHKIGPVQSNGDGRGEKATESKNTATQGSAVATALGATLIGIGAPMIPVPIIPVSVAGITLVTHGIIELAQGAASANAADKNRHSEGLLRRDADPGHLLSFENSSSENARQKLLTPEFRSLLESKGTDPEKFADEMLANGGKNATEENVARALGVSADAMNNKTPETLAIISNEMARATASAAATASNSGDNANIFSLSTEAAAEKGGELAQETSVSIQAGAPPVGKATAGDMALSSTTATQTPHDFLAALLGQGESGTHPSQSQLLNAGILTLRKNRNIFQVARGEYHSFRRWRSSY